MRVYQLTSMIVWRLMSVPTAMVPLSIQSGARGLPGSGGYGRQGDPISLLGDFAKRQAVAEMKE